MGVADIEDRQVGGGAKAAVNFANFQFQLPDAKKNKQSPKLQALPLDSIGLLP